MRPPPPRPTLFPYTTLFRSWLTPAAWPMPSRITFPPPNLHSSPPKQKSCSTCATSAVSPSAILSPTVGPDRKSTRLNSSHGYISYAVFCWKKITQASASSQPPTPRRPRFLFSDAPSTPTSYTLSLHDALPILADAGRLAHAFANHLPAAEFAFVAAETKIMFHLRDQRCIAERDFIADSRPRSEEHTSELQSRLHLVCRLLLEKNNPGICELAAPDTAPPPLPFL